METIYIYKLIDPISKKIRYIGKANDPKRRLYEHIYEARKGFIGHKHNWIRKLLRKQLKPAVGIVVKCTKENWKEKEKLWINYYGLENLVNQKEGGIEPPSSLGRKHTEETKEKIRKAHMGKPKKYPSYWLGKKGKKNPNFGRKHTKETKEKMRETHLGAKNPMYGKKNIKALAMSLKARIKGVEQIDENKCVIKSWNSTIEATKELQLHGGAVCRVCKRKRKYTRDKYNNKLYFRYKI